MTLVNLKPSDEFEFAAGRGDVLLIACGALAREIVDLIERNRWTHFDLQCLPAKWHNTPEKIVPAVRE
jgi:predicted dinucleotide-utilizing enzyme